MESFHHLTHYILIFKIFRLEREDNDNLVCCSLMIMGLPKLEDNNTGFPMLLVLVVVFFEDDDVEVSGLPLLLFVAVFFEDDDEEDMSLPLLLSVFQPADDDDDDSFF